MVAAWLAIGSGRAVSLTLAESLAMTIRWMSLARWGKITNLMLTWIVSLMVFATVSEGSGRTVWKGLGDGDQTLTHIAAPMFQSTVRGGFAVGRSGKR